VQLFIRNDVLDSTKAMQFLQPACLRDIIAHANVSSLSFNTTVKLLSLSAMQTDDLEAYIDELIDNALDLFTTSYSFAIPAFFNTYVALQGMNFANRQLANFTTPNPDDVCQPEKSVKPATDYHQDTLIGSIAVISSIIVGISVIGVACITHRKRSRKEYKSETTMLLLPNEDEKPKDDHWAMGFDPRLSLFWRLFMPSLLLITTGTFLTATLSIGASVNIVVEVGDHKVTTPPLFSFSLQNSVHDMWVAGVYPLSILIAVFSGAWPYAKILVMGFCWFLPVKILAIRKREFLLMALDMLGKWSLMDSFVMILMIVAFKFRVTTMIPDSDPPAEASFRVLVVPEYAIFALTGATILSLIASHVMLALHHSLTSVDRFIDEDKTSSLCNFKYTTKDGGHAQFTICGRISIVLLLLASGGLMIYAVIIDFFAFDFKGAAGFLLETIGQDSSTNYSLISLGTALPSASPNPNSIGVRAIQAIYFIFVVASPLLHILTLLGLWLVPLRPKIKQRIFVITEVLNAWSATDVFSVAIVSALLEIRQFAGFMVGSRCDLINEILAKYFSNELDGDNKCFDVIATLLNGCWIYIAGISIYIIGVSIVMRACYRAVDQSKDHHWTINDSSQLAENHKQVYCDPWPIFRPFIRRID
jgi:hypothetical protein